MKYGGGVVIYVGGGMVINFVVAREFGVHESLV